MAIRLILLLVGLFALALGLMYGLGRAVTALRSGEDAPVVCPEVTMPERLAGHITGLAHWSGGGFGMVLAGAVPGPASAGPEPLERLTVVYGPQMARVSKFERLLRSKVTPGSSGYHLSFHVPQGARPSTVFVTSACVPDHPVNLRTWALADRPPDEERRDMLERMRRQVPAGEFAGFIRGALDTTIPECARIAALGEYDEASGEAGGLACLGDDDVVAAYIRRPTPGVQLRELGALDIDGDGVDEIVATRQEKVFSGEYMLASELLWYDPAAGRVESIDLGPVQR